MSGPARRQGGAPRVLHAAVPATYDRLASAWDAARSGGFVEAGWIAQAVEGLPPGSAVLDLGCGSGVPITRELAARGFAVTGLDVAPAMLEIARRRLPAVNWIEADMRVFVPDGRFAAIIGWDSVFHLSAAEQRALVPRLLRRLAPGGRLLLTVGPGAGETVGRVAGAPVYHASLAPEEYAALCRAAGCTRVRFVAEDPTCGGHSILLAHAAA